MPTWHVHVSGRANPAHRGVSFPRGRVTVAASAGSDDETTPDTSSAKRTLSALDNVLGADEPDPFDVKLEASNASGSFDENAAPAAIKVPLIYTSVAGKGAQQSMGGGSLVGGALSDTSSVKPGSTYIAITVGLPERSTRAQRDQGLKGVELDWCIDTACTTNFILPQVAYGLDVDVVGVSPQGVGATGVVSGGQEMLLGTAKLGSGGEDGSGIAAITGLSAAIVQVPAPGTAGILGRSFLNCFGAVEFAWVGGGAGAAVFMHQEYDFSSDDTASKLVSLNELPCGLLAVTVTVNGIVMPALIDTGAPQTIINRAAALMCGIKLVGDEKNNEKSDESKTKTKNNNWNPFAAVQDAISRGREQALGSSGAVTVMGAGGRPVRLDKAVESEGVKFNVGGMSNQSDTTRTQSDIFLTSPQILVGDLEAFRVGLNLRQDSQPGSGDGEPGIILGLDALMSVTKVVLRTTPNEGRMKLFL